MSNIVHVKDKHELEQHLKDRHMDINLHAPILSDKIATFLLYNLSGQIVGYQRYDPSFPSAFAGDGKQSNLRDRRYYNYVSTDKIGLFGLESFNLNVPCVFVVEGVFDACRLTSRGACAIAMLTNTPSSSMKNLLLCLGKPLIAVCDNDPSGRKLKSVGHYNETVRDGKDLGDCSEEFVDFILKKYYYNRI
jgi:hypothetical protein